MGDGRVTVRAARLDDAEALATAHVRAWRAGYRGILPQDYLDGMDLDARVKQWRGWIEHGRFRLTTLALAEVDDAVAGFAIHGPESGASDDPSEGGAPSSGAGGSEGAADAVDAASAVAAVGELYSLNVHPAHWGVGVGGALMAHVTAALTQAGHTEAVLWVLPKNDRARRFYERNGWAVDGAERTDTVQGVTVDEIRYRRRLP